MLAMRTGSATDGWPHQRQPPPQQQFEGGVPRSGMLGAYPGAAGGLPYHTMPGGPRGVPSRPLPMPQAGRGDVGMRSDLHETPPLGCQPDAIKLFVGVYCSASSRCLQLQSLSGLL